jgi:hypothetical protein
MTVDEFPIEIRHLMMYRQKEQRGKKDWSEFQENKLEGFSWAKTPEKDYFWCKVINKENFELFYDKYPKVQYPKNMPEEIIMLALDRRVEQEWPNGYYLGFVWSKTPEGDDFWSSIFRGHYLPYYIKNSNNPCVEIPLTPSYREQLKDFPREVVEMMLQRQFEQTGEGDVSVFEDERDACRSDGGFTWMDTPEGEHFWKMVISDKKFDVFFEKYPKEFNSHIKTKQNDKGNTTTNGTTTSSSTGIKVQRPVATISAGERRTTSGVSGRRSATAVASRRISYQTITGF